MLNLKELALTGNSVGGSAAARLATTRPDPVKGLVLVNTGGFVPNTAVTKAFCRIMGTEAVARRMLPRFINAYMRPQASSVRVAASLWRSFAMPAYDLRGRAHRIAAPTLIVWGDRDPTLSLRIGRATQRAIPGSAMHVLHTGHVVFSSDPQNFLRVVEPFLHAK